MTGAPLPLLFVYGSLRLGCDNVEARALHSGAEWLGKAWVCGMLSEIDGYPVLTPDQAGVRVEGDLFRMHDPDEMLAFLDVYEGCAPDSPTPHQYRRMAGLVSTVSGEICAWLYVANSAECGSGASAES